MRNLHSLLLGAVLALSAACSADPEPDSFGSCSLSCAQPRVAASNYIVRPLSPETDLKIACVGDFSSNSVLALNGPVQVKYQVLEKTKVFSGGKGGGAGDAAAAPAGLVDPEDIEVPRGGIGFEPWVSGVLAGEKTSPEFINPDNTITPFKFAGVVTPSSEWCSDTCGVISFEVWPTCVENTENAISAGILVGGVKVDSFYKITVSTADPAETAP